MIQALATMGDGRVVIMLGLSQGNIDRLQDNHPLHVDPAVMLGLKPSDVLGGIVIFYGKTEGDIAKALQHSGLITNETEVKTVHKGSRNPI